MVIRFSVINQRRLTSRCTGPVTSMLYRSSAFVFYFRMMPVVASVRGARFVKVTLAGLITVLHGIITACELALKTNVFRFLASTRGAQLAGSVIKPLHNQSLHGSGQRSLFVLTQTFSPAPWTWCYTMNPWKTQPLLNIYILRDGLVCCAWIWAVYFCYIGQIDIEAIQDTTRNFSCI